MSQYDFSAGVHEDVGLAPPSTTRAGARYAVGYTQVAGATQIAIVARRTDGSLDPSFAGDGSLELTQGRDVARDRSAVLPDGRLRVLIRFDARPPGRRRTTVGDRRPAAGRIARPGLRPRSRSTPGTAGDIGNAIAVAADGRIAVAGGDGADSFRVRSTAPSSVDRPRARAPPTRPSTSSGVRPGRCC